MNTVQSTAYSDKRLNCWKKVFFAATVLLFAVDAYAGGGMSKLTNEANSWKTDAYTFIGVCAVLFMLWEGIQLWSKKIDWMDFAVACGKVIVVASIPTLVVYLWGMGGGA